MSTPSWGWSFTLQVIGLAVALAGVLWMAVLLVVAEAH